MNTFYLDFILRLDCLFSSGGDEWMLLADKLGLTPAEIRYLDNRTLNPCLEALSHIRNQRFINVDTLYNALVECGLEMLADLL